VFDFSITFGFSGLSDRMDSQADIGAAEAAPSSSKGMIIQSRSFRDGAIYLYQRSDYKKPTWLCRVKRPNGTGYVTRSTGTGDEHQAYRYADNLYHELIAEGYGKPRPTGKKFGPVIESYVKQLEPQATRQSIHYKILLMRRVKPFLGNKSFDDISTSLISQLVNFLKTNTKSGLLSPNTVRRIFSDLKHFFQWCVEEGHLTALPKFPKASGDQARRPHFNATEWKKLVGAMAPYLKDSPGSVCRDRHLLLLYIVILAETGIRVGEARTLKWRDLRPIDNHANPKAPNIALYVKGKTGIREAVGSGPRVREAFSQILKLRRKDLKDEDADIYEKDEVPLDTYVFCDKHGTPVGSFKKSFNSFIDHVGLTFDTFGQRRTIYSLRHTYATSRIEAGVNHYVLAKNMGTSVPMLERYYGHSTNVGMVDELTRPKKKLVTKASRSGNGELAWLGNIASAD
jgi:integrase